MKKFFVTFSAVLLGFSSFAGFVVTNPNYFRMVEYNFCAPESCPNGPGLSVQTSCTGGPDVCTDQAMYDDALAYFNAWPRDANGCLTPR